MTQSEHIIVAIILQKITWFLFAKKFFCGEDEVEDWKNIFNKCFLIKNIKKEANFSPLSFFRGFHEPSFTSIK